MGSSDVAGCGRWADVSLQFSASTRHKIALQHLWNARRAARLASEQEDIGRSEAFYEVRGHAMTAVISAAAFMETVVNEVFQDVADWNPGQPGRAGLSDEAVRTMKRLWGGEDLDRASVLLKYQVALAAVGQQPLDAGENPYQDAALLIKLRNTLMHFKPQWQGDDPHALERRLRRKFPENKLRAGTSPWWPNACLGAGCAHWACDVCVELVDVWWERIGLKEPCNTALEGDWPAP